MSSALILVQEVYRAFSQGDRQKLQSAFRSYLEPRGWQSRVISAIH